MKDGPTDGIPVVDVHRDLGFPELFVTTVVRNARMRERGER
jgi:hypothetical protein